MPSFVIIEGDIFIRDTSGNGPVAVKGASTSPTVSDPALVVVLSPNQGVIPVSSSPATASADLAAGLVNLGGGTSGSFNPIRATVYNEQSSDAQRSIASSVAADTSAGIGARTVEITYLTSTGSGPFTETVTMNGTTAVNTTNTNICFIEKMRVVTAGSNNTNVGTITLFASTGGGGGTVASIGVGNIVAAVGDSRTLWAQHYVPSGMQASITGLAIGATQPTVFHWRKHPIGVANAVDEIVTGFLTTTAAFQRNYGAPVVVAGPARILAYGVPSTNNVSMTASFDFFET